MKKLMFETIENVHLLRCGTLQSPLRMLKYGSSTAFPRLAAGAFSMVSLFMTTLLWPKISLAQISPADTGLYETGNPIYGQPPADIGAYIGTNLINPAFGIIGSLFLVLIIYGGFMWMTARGESGPVEKAQKILTNSIIGLVIVIVAYALTRFVLAGLTGQL